MFQNDLVNILKLERRIFRPFLKGVDKESDT